MQPVTAIFVLLTGNVREFMHHLGPVWESLGLPKAESIRTGEMRGHGWRIVHVSDWHNLRGLQNWTMIKRGTWYTRDDIEEFEREYQCRLLIGDALKPELLAALVRKNTSEQNREDRDCQQSKL